MKKYVVLSACALACALTSCMTPDPVAAQMPDIARQDATVALAKRGPTLTLDETARLADPTTLQILEERSQELARAKKRVDELETELQRRAQELDRVRDETQARTQEKEQLEGLLREATENERLATEKALSAEIARLKFEQEMLRLKLGNVLADQ